METDAVTKASAILAHFHVTQNENKRLNPSDTFLSLSGSDNPLQIAAQDHVQ
jgi:hypothetical protein